MEVLPTWIRPTALPCDLNVGFSAVRKESGDPAASPLKSVPWRSSTETDSSLGRHYGPPVSKG